MNKISITIESIEKYKVIASYKTEGIVGTYINQNEIPFLEFQTDISEVPKSVLIIPFLANILPIAWIFNSIIDTPEVDKIFLNNLDKIENGYKNMYPGLEWFNTNIITKSIDNTDIPSKINSGLFFSGGIDAWTTLIKHLDENPMLITIWGADVKYDDDDSWQIVNAANTKTAENFNLNYQVIKSNFRKTIYEWKLDRAVKNKAPDMWWHGFQHGISIISHAAPLAYLYGFENLYIASSYPESLTGLYTCASDPTIDNYVNFCRCNTIHDGREFDRLGKIRFLMEQKEDVLSKMKFRVCWQSNSNGKNCCKCEKCIRTILALESVNCTGGIERYGFSWSYENIVNLKETFQKSLSITQEQIKVFYIPIQKEFIKNKKNLKKFNSYKWFIFRNLIKFQYKIKIQNKQNDLKNKIKKFLKKPLKQKIESIKRKITKS